MIGTINSILDQTYPFSPIPIAIPFNACEPVISEATAKNLNVYGVHVQVDPGCILKAARAFLVFKSVEELGEIILLLKKNLINQGIKII